jgi:glutamyl-tRNA synthetase
VVFTDLVRGEIKTDATLYGDLVIARSLDSALYNFAVVVDDLTMGITHVIRGEDHISNTPKQILIFEALGATPPTYGHLSLLLAPDRTKLSKRRNKTSLLQYRDEGFLPEAMCNFLALMGWHQSGDREVFTLPELIEAFSTDRLQKAGSVFDEVKLRWINREHMKLIPPTDLAQRLRPFIGPGAETVTDATLEAYVVAEQGRADTLAELAAAAAWLTAYVPPSAQMLVPKDSTLEATRAYLAAMRDVVAQSGDTWLSDLEQYLLRESEGAGKRAVYWPLRVALSGLEKSPDPMTLGKVLGREAALQRLEAAVVALSE